MKPKRKIKVEPAQKSSPTSVVAQKRSDATSMLCRLMPAIVAIVTLVTYLPALHNGFVNWDDDENLVSNPYFRGLGWPQLRWMFTTFHLGHYQPLSWITFAVDYLIWGMNPYGYHLTNLVLHTANAVLFYFLAVRILSLNRKDSEASHTIGVVFAAGIAALFFAIHPLRVESVAWATERRDVLSGLFFLCTLLFYLRAVAMRQPGARWLWLGASLVFYVMSLLSKAAGMTLPVVLLVLDIYPLRRLGWEKGRWLGAEARPIWLEKLPFAVFALVAGIVASAAQSAVGAMKSFEVYSVPLRAFQALYGLSFYLWKTLLPVNLSPLYQIPKFIDPTAPAFVISAGVVLSVTIIGILLRRRWPAGLAIWICYAAILAPVLGVAQSGEQFVADRYSYLPCLGWALLVGAGVLYVWRCWVAGKITNRYFAGFVLLCPLIFTGMGIMTWQQTKVWHDSETLWRRALQLDPTSSVVHNNLANALLEKGDKRDAIELYRKALELDPGYAEAYFDLGMAYVATGQLQPAVEQFLTGLKIDPDNAKAHYYLGLVNVRRGDLRSAVEQFRQSLNLSPSQSSVHADLGTALALQGNLDEAADEFRQAIALRPNFASAHQKLGRVLAAQNRLSDAIREFTEAVRLDPDDADAHLSLSQALAEQGFQAEAAQHYQQALQIQEKLRQAAQSR